MIRKKNKVARRNFWTNPFIVCLVAFICSFLWGSAFPCVKIGYRMLQVDSSDTGAQILFAGIRFTLAGVMVIIGGSLMQHRFLRPDGKASWGRVLFLMLFQTFLQYYFFYIGLANTSGVKSAVIEAANMFLVILFSAYVFHYEKMTARKMIGCLIGFAGVVLIQLPGQSLDFSFSMRGEGFMILSTISAALSSNFSKTISRKENPVMVSGYQFLTGGLVMVIYALLAGGKLSAWSAASVLLLIYMAFISAAAYTLWTILLKYNRVSRVAVFGFMNPMIGVLLSALLLGEQEQAFSLTALFSLILVTIGIVIVFREPAKSVKSS